MCFRQKERSIGLSLSADSRADVTGLGCCISLVFIKQKMRSEKYREHASSVVCMSVCVVLYCVPILATMIAIAAEEGDIRPCIS